MGKASSSKKVARAAGIGGGRTNRGKAPVLWYSTLVVILLAGVGLTAFSRGQRLEELGSPTSKEEPRPGTHWHVALGVRVCDQWLDQLRIEADNNGIHTHGDGLIHVEPNLASVSGSRAVFERFAETVKGEVAADRFAWPEGDGKKKKVEHKTGDKCGEQEGEVKTFYNGEPHEGDPSEIRLTDQGRLVLAFVPKGTTYEQIGDPPSAPELAKQGGPSPEQQQTAVDPATGTPIDPTVTPGAPTEGAPADPSATPAAPAEGAPATTAAPAGAPDTTAAPASSTPPSSEAPATSAPPPAG